MKDLFPGYYKPSEEEFDNMWKNGLFIFDTNVLLDIYRYSDETSEALINIFESLSNRIWIPYQAALEYHKNMYTVIATEAKSYTKASNDVKELLNVFTAKRGHPFLDKELYQEFQQVFSKLSNELDNKQKNMISMLTINPLKEKLASVLSGKIGEGFSPEELANIYQEGEIRYSAKTPPGFSDKDKPGNDKYGDLVFWKEVLKKAASVDVPIFLITGDTKEDWFLKEMGRTISPRPELIAEFKNVNNILFYIYPTHTFLGYAKQYLNAAIEQDSIDEVKELERVIVNDKEKYDYKKEIDEKAKIHLNELLKNYYEKYMPSVDQSKIAELTNLHQYQSLSHWLDFTNQSKIAELTNLYQDQGLNKWIEAANQLRLIEMIQNPAKSDRVRQEKPSELIDNDTRVSIPSNENRNHK